jgi:hypothetical protein
MLLSSHWNRAATDSRALSINFADAAVIGSAIVGEIEKVCGQPDLVQRIADFTQSLLAKRERRQSATGFDASEGGLASA